MTIKEVDLWTAYRHKYGPLNPVRMYDHGFAIVASMIANVNGGKSKPLDFMPYGKEIPEEKEMSSDEFISALIATGRAKLGR